MMIVDFGGGTLDVSIVDCFENIIEITAIAGDNRLRQLGGPAHQDHVVDPPHPVPVPHGLADDLADPLEDGLAQKPEAGGAGRPGPPGDGGRTVRRRHLYL